MAKIYNKDGVVVGHEPPYTEAEEDEFYRRVGGGPVSIIHAPKPAAGPSLKSPKPPRGNKSKAKMSKSDAPNELHLIMGEVHADGGAIRRDGRHRNDARHPRSGHRHSGRNLRCA